MGKDARIANFCKGVITVSSGILDIEQEPEKTLKWNAKRLIFQRRNSGLSRKQLADVLGVSQQQIVCMENCTRIPSEEMLKTLTSFFDVPEDYFGVESLGGPIQIKPKKLSPQDERQQEAKARLIRQRQTLRKMMKIAGFPLNCTGLHYLAEAIGEPNSDTCKYLNGEIAMPPDTVRKANAWFSSIPKTIKADSPA